VNVGALGHFLILDLRFRPRGAVLPIYDLKTVQTATRLAAEIPAHPIAFQNDHR
jgi:hypothetical protein